ncbi:MAG: hypothetical protein EA375_02460 [Acholeplasmataceae bacterium]|nr:MAG: hypothetical protein EA375_02460 [Acholeplasmataceae bacterium]
MKKALWVLLVLMGLLYMGGCRERENDQPIEDPLQAAIDELNDASSYTMEILFETDDESFPMNVRVTRTAVRVEALDEIVFYSVDGDLCHAYERIAGVWTRFETSCSEKGTAELAFLNNFSADYFVKNTEDDQTVYVLKMEFYTQLSQFLGGSNTQNFRMILHDDSIHMIHFQMTRNDIVFQVSIEIKQINSTTVSLPVIE